ncbi:hypothetical protein IV102_06015 [bacterium]|nr:hypothetical protein [bacterium]
MNWTFLEKFPQYCPAAPMRTRFDQLYQRLQAETRTYRGHSEAAEAVMELFSSPPCDGTGLKEHIFTLEACLEQALVQLPESRLLDDVLFKIMNRPKNHWVRSREAFLETVYISKPRLASKHLVPLLETQEEVAVLHRAERGDRVAIRTLLNLLPRRALVAGLTERLWNTQHRQSLLVELLDSFQDLDWLSHWSPQCHTRYGQAPGVRQRMQNDLDLVETPQRVDWQRPSGPFSWFSNLWTRLHRHNHR